MRYKLYKDNTPTDTYVSWHLYDEKGERIGGQKNYNCFAPITYHAISKNVASIVFYKKLKNIPYSEEVINNWVNELNELGFPCSVEILDGIAYFKIELKNYDKKMWVNCALQLLRCLTESGICYVPELYFKEIAKSKKDKFILLQKAHKDLRNHEEAIYCNTNHMITYNGNGRDNIPREKFFERVKKTKFGVYDGDYCSLSGLWNYTEPKEDIVKA